MLKQRRRITRPPLLLRGHGVTTRGRRATTRAASRSVGATSGKRFKRLLRNLGGVG